MFVQKVRGTEFRSRQREDTRAGLEERCQDANPH
jgi:hypothetical protein